MRLVRATRPLMEAAIEGDEALAAALGHAVAPEWVTFMEALPYTRDSLPEDGSAPEWSTRLFVVDDELVGWGGFKGPPGEEGEVEIGYEIAASRRNRGLATAAAQAMLDEAIASPDIVRVIAHTLPEVNTSNRLLVRLGFAHEAELEEGGERVWRYGRSSDAPR